MCSEQACREHAKVSSVTPRPELRRRLAGLVLLIGAIVVGRVLFERAPRSVDLRFELGEAPVEELDVRYLVAGEEVAGFRRHDAAGLRSPVRHAVDLAPGRYEVRALVRTNDRERLEQRALRVPSDGVVTIDLSP